MAQPYGKCPFCVFGNSWRGRWPGKPLLNMNLSLRSALIFIFQVFSPAKVIFAGVGVLLSVRILLYTFARAIVTPLLGSYGCPYKPGYSHRYL
jgi:hypothetical protein